METGTCTMPYVDAESGQLYLKRLLREDLKMFLLKMDEFRDLVLQSSEIIEPDQNDGNGVLLQKGYLDMVPLNSFYINGSFVFYGQEFCKERYPLNAIVWHMIETFYAGDLEAKKLLPIDILLERYGLMRKMDMSLQALMRKGRLYRHMAAESARCQRHFTMRLSKRSLR